VAAVGRCRHVDDGRCLCSSLVRHAVPSVGDDRSSLEDITESFRARVTR
jgi:hypothetical protein